MVLTPPGRQTGLRVLASALPRIGALLAFLPCAVLLFSATGFSIAAAIAVVALVGLSAWRLAEGVLIAIALTPLAGTATAALTGGGGQIAEALVLAVIAGFLLRCAAGVTRWPSQRGVRWAAVLLMASVASAIVQLAVLRVQLSPDLFGGALVEGFRTYLHTPTDVSVTIRPSLVLAEGLLLFMAVASLRGEPENPDLPPRTPRPAPRPPSLAIRSNAASYGEASTPDRLMRMFLAGACGAAALNLTRVAAGALRSETPASALVSLLRTVRIAAPFTDVNAAGSYFALAMCAAAVFALLDRGRWRVVWVVAVSLCGAAAFTTGSRTAIAAALVTVAATVLLLGRRRAAALQLLVAACVLSAVAAPFVSARLVNRNTADALNMRAELGRAAWRMAVAEPVFGVGVGQFYPRSFEFIHRPVDRPMYVHENAHNNFLQFLGELGFPGFLAFIILVASVAHDFVRSRERPLALAAAAAGLIAFLLTCLTGHPLLDAEVSYSFWMVLGTAAAAAAPRPARSKLPNGLLVAAALFVCATLPSRIVRAASGTDMEHRAYGVSTWSFDPDGNRYRRMVGDVTLFVSRDARVAELPYRLEADGPAVVLDVRLRGEPANRLVVSDTTWRTYRFMVVPRSDDPRFLKLTLTPVTPSPSHVLLGRIDVHQEPARK
jgi:O-antigen ligase/polysaccharide polymerase Wzy-like membrane protein